MFDEKLAITLTLGGGAQRHVVRGGRIKSCAVELGVHGFAGQVTFWSEPDADDPLLAWLTGSELIEIDLAVASTVEERKPSRLRLRALAAERALVELPVELRGKTMLLREYTLHFCDAAALLWRQHHPLELRSDLDDSPATAKAMLCAQEVGGIELAVALDDADVARPLMCIPTGDGGASFYDFVLWYADRAGGCFHHDYYSAKPHQYRLTSARSSHAHGDDGPLTMREVARSRLTLPAPRRCATRLRNAHSEAADKTTLVAQPDAVDGVARDRLIRPAAGADLEAHKQREQQRLAPAHPELELELACFPASGLMPGAKAQLHDQQFSPDLHASGKTFRAIALSFAAEAEGDHAERGDGEARVYRASLHLLCESEDDRSARLPAHASPAWPLLVEGKIVSDLGEAGDRSYSTVADANSGTDSYLVHVPLWNQTVKVPFQPQFLPGHVFAPAFKGSRVLVALYFDHAEIVQFLDWGPDVRLPMERGGNHWLFGKNATSQTSLKHVYVGDKPVFSLDRVADADHGRFQLEEGGLVLEVKEDPSASQKTAPRSAKPEQSLALDKLQSDAQTSQQKLEGSTKANERKLDDKLSGVQAGLEGSLQVLGGEMKGKTAAARSTLEGGLAQLDGRVAELRARFETAIAELNAKRGGA